MGNAAALAALDERIAKIRTLPLALPEVARRVADEARRVIAANISAQRGPDGKPWPATKGHVRRPIIPTKSTPQPIVDAIDRVVVDVLAKHMRGAT